MCNPVESLLAQASVYLQSLPMSFWCIVAFGASRGSLEIHVHACHLGGYLVEVSMPLACV
jgi:hypothetical protein